jgi:hypothetical protein
MAVKKSTDDVPMEPQKTTLSGPVPYLLVFAWIFLFTAALEMFVLWDWDHGIIRFVLLLLVGFLAFIVKWSLPFYRLEFSHDKVWVAFGMILLLLAVALNTSTALCSLKLSYLHNKIESDQAQAALRTVSLLKRGINPYSKIAFVDFVEYDFAKESLRKMPQCGGPLPPDEERLMTKISDGTATEAEMSRFQVVTSKDSACRSVKRQFERMGFKYGPILILSYFPFISLWGVAGINISHIIILGMLLTLMILWTREISRSWFLAICSPLLILSSIHLRWNILDQGHSDILPTFLAMLFLFSWSHKRYAWAAIVLGLCIGTKTAPGIAFIPLLLVQPHLLLITAGIVIMIYLPFIVWDAGGLVNHVLFPFFRTPDSTALAYFLAPWGSMGLTLFVALGCLWFIWKMYRDAWSFPSALGYLVFAHLGLLGTSGALHNNYLVWLLPLLSIFLIQSITEVTCRETGLQDNPRRGKRSKRRKSLT